MIAMIEINLFLNFQFIPKGFLILNYIAGNW